MDFAGFGRIGVDVVEVGEIGRVFGVAVEGQGVGAVDHGVGEGRGITEAENAEVEYR